MEYLQIVMQTTREYVPVLYYVTVFFGLTALLQYLWTIFRGIVRLVFQRRLKLAERYGQGSWVLVTGASEGTFSYESGIGREFALEFAREGFNILILARTESKLQKVK
jgi:17beta-estradiol 17-dehydrogenase / very-long-chain 3-oxoacyl-CoA reductase